MTNSQQSTEIVQMIWALSAFMRGVLDSVRPWHLVIIAVVVLAVIVDFLLYLI